jgi:hypothetical protein
MITGLKPCADSAQIITPPVPDGKVQPVDLLSCQLASGPGNRILHSRQCLRHAAIMNPMLRIRYLIVMSIMLLELSM